MKIITNKKLISYSKRILLLIVFIYLFSNTEIDLFIKKIHGINITLWLVSFAAITVGSIFVTGLYTTIISNYILKVRNNYFRFVEINLYLRFYNLFMPAAMSVGLRWYHYNKLNISRSDSVATIFFEKLLEIFVFSFSAVVFLSMDRSNLNFAYSPLIIICIGVLIFTLIVVFLGTKSDIVEKIKNFFLKEKSPKFTWIFEKIDLFSYSINKFKKIPARSLILIITVAFCSHLAIVSGSYLLNLAFHLNLSILTICWIRSIIALLALLPFSVSGLGIRELGIVTFFSLYGIEKETALLFSFSLYLSYVVAGVSGGLLKLIRS